MTKELEAKSKAKEKLIESARNFFVWVEMMEMRSKRSPAFHELYTAANDDDVDDDDLM